MWLWGKVITSFALMVTCVVKDALKPFKTINYINLYLLPLNPTIIITTIAMTLDLYTSLSLAGGLISLILAPLGCLLLWQRKSLLSDSLSHASFLGMSIAYVFKFPLALGVALSSLAVLSTMKSLFKQSSLKMDVWLNLIAVS